MNIKVIGLGGIGSVLVGRLARYLEYSFHDSVFLTLIDGDSYEVKNRERQDFKRIGNKASVQVQELMEYSNFLTKSIREYTTKDTVSEHIQDGDVIFLCVDNHKTRKIVSEYCGTLENVTLISGGNDITDGNVQIYVRKEGQDLTPSLTAYHREIQTPADKSPDEMSCEELSVSEPQLYFVNAAIAILMCCAFWNVVVENNIKASEVYFDMKLMAADAKTRTVKRPQTSERRTSNYGTVHERSIGAEDVKRTQENVRL